MGIEEHILTLTVENEFYAEWLLEADNLKSIENILRYHAICPADMQIRVICETEALGEKELKEQKKKKERLKRRYDEQLGK